MVVPLRASNEHRFTVRVLRAKGHTGFPNLSFSLSPYRGWSVWSPTARVQRGPSQAARCASTGDQQTAAFLLGYLYLPTFLSRVAWLILDCARRTSTFLSCAFREQEDDQATLPLP